MLNHIVVMGRLTRDPELRRTPAGVPVASFSIACDRDWTDKEGGKRRSAEVVADNIYFGDSKSKDSQEPPASAGGPVVAAGGDVFGLPSGFAPNFGAFPGDDNPL